MALHHYDKDGNYAGRTETDKERLEKKVNTVLGVGCLVLVLISVIVTILQWAWSGVVAVWTWAITPSASHSAAPAQTPPPRPMPTALPLPSMLVDVRALRLAKRDQIRRLLSKDPWYALKLIPPESLGEEEQFEATCCFGVKMYVVIERGRATQVVVNLPSSVHRPETLLGLLALTPPIRTPERWSAPGGNGVRWRDSSSPFKLIEASSLHAGAVNSTTLCVDFVSATRWADE